MNDKQLFILKDRFTEDYKFPITVFEPGIWEFYLKLYEPTMGTETKWNQFLGIIEEEFGGNVEEYLHAYKTALKEVLIGALKSVPAYDEKFNNSKDTLPEFEVYPEYIGKGLREDDIYNEGFVGNTYISIDLSNANLQALYHISSDFFKDLGPISWENSPGKIYKEWLIKTVKGTFPPKAAEYMSELKHPRQVVFGNCNPKRQTKIEKWLIAKAGENFYELFQEIGLKGKFVMHGWDEIIYQVEPDQDISNLQEALNQCAMRVADNEQIYVKPGIYNLSSIEYRTKNDVSIRVYKKEFLNGEVKYKGINKLYHAQIYEDLHGIEPDPEDRDLMFYHQTNDLSKFIYRIKRV